MDRLTFLAIQAKRKSQPKPELWRVKVGGVTYYEHSEYSYCMYYIDRLNLKGAAIVPVR